MLRERKCGTGPRAGVWFAALLLALTWLAGPAHAATGAEETVARLNEKLLEVMKNADELGFQGRFDALEPTLEETFDFSRMARASLGRHWEGLSEEQRATFVEHFRKNTIATVANRFDGYSGETFEVTGQREWLRGSVLVETRLIRPNGEPVSLNYLLREDEEGNWRAIDVFLNATVSEMAVKRSEYVSVIKNRSFEALVDLLEEKTAQLAE